MCGARKVMVFSSKRDNFFLVLENSGESTPVVLKPEGEAPSGAEQVSPSEQAESKPPVLLLSAPATGQTLSSTQAGIPEAPSPDSENAATTTDTASGSESAPEAGSAPSAVMTTAESIAAELAAAEAERPALTLTTFAPDNLLPGQALVQRRRRPGASMKSFSGMAEELFKS